MQRNFLQASCATLFESNPQKHCLMSNVHTVLNAKWKKKTEKNELTLKRIINVKTSRNESFDSSALIKNKRETYLNCSNDNDRKRKILFWRIYFWRNSIGKFHRFRFFGKLINQTTIISIDHDYYSKKCNHLPNTRTRNSNRNCGETGFRDGVWKMFGSKWQMQEWWVRGWENYRCERRIERSFDITVWMIAWTLNFRRISNV